MSNGETAHFAAILGVTGCGKTTELKRQLAKLQKKKQRRTFVWSPKEPLDNYAALYKGSKIVRTAGEVLAALQEAGDRGEFHLVFFPTLNKKIDQALFSMVCKMLLLCGGVVLIVDELHTVTEPSRAPDGWSKVCFMGRGYGVYVFALSQRPASCDKAIFGSLSFLHVGQLTYPADQKVAAEFLGVKTQEVAALVGYQSIQKHLRTGEIIRNL